MTAKLESGADGLEVITIPAFRDNYIWLLRNAAVNGRSAVVVDPGDAGPVEQALTQAGLDLAAILVTHHHADHQGGVPRLVARYRAAVYGPGNESITGLTHEIAGGETIELPELGASLRVLSVPGHTRGHLAYLIGNRLFCGDTLFGAGCGRLFEGTPAQMSASLGLLASLPGDTAVYCAHEYTEANLRFAAVVEPGNPAIRLRAVEAAAVRARGEPTVPSILALEKATNPFLRCDQPGVIAAAEARGAVANDRVSVFAAIRSWRNEF